MFKYERSRGHWLVMSWARVRRVARGNVVLGVVYCEWYGVWDFVVLSVVEVCADYGVGVCVNVCGVVCVVVCCLFLTPGCCLLWCDVV